MVALSNNPLLWPLWLQIVLPALTVAEFLVLRVGLGPVTPTGRRRWLARRVSRDAYEGRRADRQQRRSEDLLWTIHREPAYELAVDLALERAVADSLPLVRTARAERAHAHLQVVA